MNNQIWVMSSAFPGLSLPELIDQTKEIGAQGIEALVFRREGTRQDHVATHIDYETFGPGEAQGVIDAFNKAGLKLSIGAYENLIGGDPAERKKNQDHLLYLIRMAALMGGDGNNVKVGTFVGYNHELGIQDNGFEKNLEEYKNVFTPVVKYAEDLGVTIMYENCPMEGWKPAATPVTYNNLPATLAARKLMYALIPSKAHGETYDPSHDIWQYTNPSEVLKASDMSRIHRIHVKGTRLMANDARINWGGLYPMQEVNAELAEKAGVPTCAHEWDRHHYEPMLPGFGGTDSMDWRSFITVLMEKGYQGPFPIENEAANSKGTGDHGAIVQGFMATILCLIPMIWPMDPGHGYQYDESKDAPLKDAKKEDIPIVTMDKL
ncbi:sugar phosphate isomerase/epimerase family protein [Fibrobacterota bacterium]